MITAYRLCSSRYVPSSGIGAALHGGTWNAPEKPVIYTASSRSLAALEILVHFSLLPTDFVLTAVEIPDAVRIIEVESLDVWDPTDTSPNYRQDIGTYWINGQNSAVLSVPSSIISAERNYVLNVAHTDFAQIRFLNSEPFDFDARLKATV